MLSTTGDLNTFDKAISIWSNVTCKNILDQTGQWEGWIYYQSCFLAGTNPVKNQAYQ